LGKIANERGLSMALPFSRDMGSTLAGQWLIAPGDIRGSTTVTLWTRYQAKIGATSLRWLKKGLTSFTIVVNKEGILTTWKPHLPAGSQAIIELLGSSDSRGTTDRL
jgi:hypothetical protein